MKWWHRLLLILILIIAAGLRLTGIDWDDYNHYHPDERYITWIATTIEPPDELDTALVPSQSAFNPFYWPPDAASEGIVVEQGQPRNFAYGHVPLYMGVAATKLVEAVAPVLRGAFPAGWLLTRDLLNGAGLVEFRHLTAVARALTGLVDVATVLLVFLLGKRLFGVPAGVLAAAFLALNVMHIQLAHFFTVDPYLTLFTVAALYAMTRALPPNHPTNKPTNQPTNKQTNYPLLLAAACIGLAVGSKFSAVMLFLPLAVALWLDRTLTNRQYLLRLLGAVAVAVLVFAVTNPFAVLDWTCEAITPATQIGPVRIPALDWQSCYLKNVGQQSAMVRGGTEFPFTRQYLGTLPYLYPVEMQLRWGMGLLLGVVAFAGFGWAAWRGGRTLARFWQQRDEPGPFRPGPASLAELVVLAWTVPYFLTTGAFTVKFMRYMQPLTPFLMVYGAALLLRWPRPGLRRAAIALVLVGTGLYALAFVQLYDTPHPWVSASRWIYDNVEPGTLILSEKWDDSLPSTMVVDGELQRRQQYDNRELTWMSGTGAEDDLDKLQANLSRLARADYVTILSNRVYGVVPRLPERFPLSGQYHRLLFDGSLGYEVVYVSGRGPHLGDVYLWPDRFSWPGLEPPPAVAAARTQRFPGPSLGRADESFTVYDQPLTIIFRNTGRLSVEEMLALFGTD